MQTKAYMRAVFRASNPDASPAKLDALSAARLGRQEVLRGDNPPQFWAILDEAVLQRPVGGPSVMREQLAALLVLVDTRNTTIQVLPFRSGEYALMNGTFILLTLPDHSTIAYQEGGGSGEVFDDRETVSERLWQYDRMKAGALPLKESAALIRAAMEEHDRCDRILT